jgi:cAMP-binding proteins - catabolite gene activator and regulatory subunit of cAMP-dependent protein kinases
MTRAGKRKHIHTVIDYNSARIAGLNTDWEELLHLGNKLCYAKNTIIPHETAKGIFYLTKGTVELSYNNASGHKRIALYYGPGTLINEARSLTGHNLGGTFTCMEAVELYQFNKDLCSEDFIRTHPHLIRNLLKTMAVKMLLHYCFVTSMGTGSHLSLVCRFILSSAAAHGSPSHFSLGMTQQEVADLIGMHRATLARALQKLKRMGVIEKFTATSVRISDYATLEKLAGD